MESITLTVVVSAVTSTIVSLIAFVVGVRVSKDQGDRARLRDTYQRLFEHYRELRDAIDDGRPRVWSDFPVEGKRYVPPFSKMVTTGEANLILSGLAKQCELVERDTLVAGDKYRQWVVGVWGPSLLQFIDERAPNSARAPAKRAYRETRAGEFALQSQDELSKLIRSLGQTGLCFEILATTGKMERRFLYSDTEGYSFEALLRNALSLAQSDPQWNTLRTELQKARKDVGELVDRLSARVREPHPLLESIGRSFKDLVQRT